MFNVKNYISDSGNDPVCEAIEEIPDKYCQDKVIAAVKVLSVYGTGAKSELLKIRKIRGKILELKVDNFRIMFSFRPQNEILLLHAFTKKRQKTDTSDIVLAEKRLKKYQK